MSASKDRHVHSSYEKMQINAAKYYIANMYEIDPQEAYDRMIKYSNDNHIRMCDVARRIARREEPIVNAMGNRS